MGIDIKQYRASLAITSTMQGTWKQKLYEELGLRSISKRLTFLVKH